MESSKCFLKVNMNIFNMIIDLLDADSMITLASINSFFRKTLGINLNVIKIYYYLRNLVHLYTKESYCYMLSNDAFHKKILKRFSLYEEADIFKAKTMAIIHLLEHSEFDLDFSCVGYGHFDLRIFYQVLYKMPTKYKEMFHIVFSHIKEFDFSLLENLLRITRIEIPLESSKLHFINTLFNSNENSYRIKELFLIIGESLNETLTSSLLDYYKYTKNSLEFLNIEFRIQEVDMSYFEKLIEYNHKSLKVLKIKGGVLTNHELFIKSLVNLKNLEQLVLLYENDDIFFEKTLFFVLNSLTHTYSITTSIRHQEIKNLLYENKFKGLNLCEFYMPGTDLYNKEFFQYFISNEHVVYFEINFDNIDVLDKDTLNYLENLTESLKAKTKLYSLKIKSSYTTDQCFLNFISNFRYLKNLEEIIFDIMSVSNEFLEILVDVVKSNPRIYKIHNDIWANISIQYGDNFIFYIDALSDLLLELLNEIRNHHKSEHFKDNSHFFIKNSDEIKIMVKDINLNQEEEIFFLETWRKYPELTNIVYSLLIDFNSVPENICQEIKEFLLICPNLKILCFEKCEVEENGWEIISDGFSNLQALNELKMICTNVDDKNCIQMLNAINTSKFINLDFRGNELGDETLNFIFSNYVKFKSLIRLKYFNHGKIDLSLELVDEFLKENNFIFTIELNKKSVSGNNKEYYMNLVQKYPELFLSY